MKKVIKHGYKYNMESTCPMCGCVFSYDWEDVTIVYEPSVTNLGFGQYETSCPECGHQFRIYTEVPAYKITCDSKLQEHLTKAD